MKTGDEDAVIGTTDCVVDTFVVVVVVVDVVAVVWFVVNVHKVMFIIGFERGLQY